MGNYENLKQSITEVIRTNGNQEITGAVLQSTLLTIISTVGANATFAGIATPTTNPGTPDQNVFYLASEAGTYTNFGGVELQGGLSVLMLNGSSWSSQQMLSIDDVPTAGSDNLVKSGGIQEELALGAVYDVSAKNPTAGTNNDGKFESLSALLEDANLDTLIPVSVRKGGMSIKFVQSSDNKYVQYRLMSDSFNTTPANWQGVDDEPTTGSDNLVKSGGAEKNLTQIIEFVGGTSDKADFTAINSGYWGKGVKVEDCQLGHTFDESNDITDNVFAQALAKVNVSNRNYLIVEGIRNSNNSYCSWFVLNSSNSVIGINNTIISAPSRTVIDLTAYSGATLVYVSYQYNQSINIYYSEKEPAAELIDKIPTLVTDVSDLKEDTFDIHKLLGHVNVEVAEHTVVGTLSYNGQGLKRDVKIGDTFNELSSFSLCYAQGIEKINVTDKHAVVIQGVRNSNDSFYSWFIVDSKNVIIAVGTKTYQDPSYLSIDISAYNGNAAYLYVSRLYSSLGAIQAWFAGMMPVSDVPASSAQNRIITEGKKSVAAGSSTYVSPVFSVSGIGAKKGDILVIETNSYCKRIILFANSYSGMNDKTYVTDTNTCTVMLLEDTDMLRVAAYVDESSGVAVAGEIIWKAYIIHSALNIYSDYVENMGASIIGNAKPSQFMPAIFDDSIFGFDSAYRGKGVGLMPLLSYNLSPKYTQSAACFGNYGFIISEGTYSCFHVVDMKTAKYLQYIAVDSANTHNHNNTAAFSSLKYNQDDEYPLMFCGDLHDENFPDGLKVTAYRIYKDGTVWKATGMYNINLPSEYGEGKTGINSQAVVANDKIYILANMGQGVVKIKVLQNPSGINQDITLTDADVIDTFEVGYNFEMLQDAFVYNNIFYQVDDKTIIAIDLVNKTLAGTVELPTSEISEYEGCFVYNGKLIVTTINSERTLWFLQRVDFQQASRLSVVTFRPDGKYLGECLYDASIKKPIYWNGSAWTDALGNILT